MSSENLVLFYMNILIFLAIKDLFVLNILCTLFISFFYILKYPGQFLNID